MSEKLEKLKEICASDPLLDQLYMRIQHFDEGELFELLVLIECILEKDNEKIQAQLKDIRQKGSAALKAVVEFYITEKIRSK